ncbi:MAG: glucose-6-phosphate isomerase [Nitrospirota bacterium]
MNPLDQWNQYDHFLCTIPSVGMMIDISRMRIREDYFIRMEPKMQQAFHAMDALEAGSIANPDEHRMVGHYWLRAPERAPSNALQSEIQDTLQSIKEFAFSIHAGKINPRKRQRFTRFLSIGIGGSALGPQFIADALGSSADKMKPCFLDNTDPDGIDRLVAEIGNELDNTLVLVISKSGGTKETKNGMLEVAAAFKKANLVFEQHAVAVTGTGSELYKHAQENRWLAIFPMWDWVGGRTSVMSAVGLLPAALQGIPIDELLQGGARCDEATRSHDIRTNPSALLALAWHYATNGKGEKDMVILPYKDRLQLFSRYLQQLIMESLGKEKDRDGNIVHQGIAVYGNKGTTDQHAYVQQLRDGVNNFFVTFIEVLQDRNGPSPEVASGVTSGDYLNAYLQGTRNALYEKERMSLTITIDKLNAGSIGALIALYERAVGLYAELVNINAYHQPGVEAGKKMAEAAIELQRSIFSYLQTKAGESFTVEEIARAMHTEQYEYVFKILEHASANSDHRVTKHAGKTITDTRYSRTV